jgi:(E)-4-hydroxy-3-methylbut-2-enyl-diphosphate synthase
MSKKYCPSIFQTKRFKTREVLVGSVGVGGENPIRIQSMTTSSTRDVDATVEQVMRLADAGCEIVRVTVQGMKEADSCEAIKSSLVSKGYNIPLVADIHFYPPAAMRVVEFVDKVRINPGNFVDKRASFKVLEYDDASYEKEIEKIEEKFAPLIMKCKKLKRAIRIGTNHGSLSDRVMNRYGDTPMGMVESAVEFTEVARKYDFHDIVFSMKSSNPQVMIQAYRMLAARMIDLGWDYPLHLGVTEAGEGEDGRVKSAMGMGALLLDGIGDTIRVSLTEDPWHEIDPCKRLLALAESYQDLGVEHFLETQRDIDAIERRLVQIPEKAPMHRDGSVFLKLSEEELCSDDFYTKIGLERKNGGLKLTRSSADAIIVDEMPIQDEALQRLKVLIDLGVGVISTAPIEGKLTLCSIDEAFEAARVNAMTQRFSVKKEKMNPLAIQVNGEEDREVWEKLKEIPNSLIILSLHHDAVHKARRFFDWIKQAKLDTPVILHFAYSCEAKDLSIRASAEMALSLCDGVGDGLCIEAPLVGMEERRLLCFNIFQGARMRTIKTDFISCPSCGRTLFNLQEVSERIRQRTGHLPGVKIAIMGCIVNGPGEMADADFGYVGSRPGKVDLYVKKERVERNIDFEDADDRLIELIKAHGRWVEPTEESEEGSEAKSPQLG